MTVYICHCQVVPGTQLSQSPLINNGLIVAKNGNSGSWIHTRESIIHLLFKRSRHERGLSQKTLRPWAKRS